MEAVSSMVRNIHGRQPNQLRQSGGEKDARTERRRKGRGKVKADDEPGLICLDKFPHCARIQLRRKPLGYSNHPVEQIRQVQGIKTQGRVLKDGKKMECRYEETRRDRRRPGTPALS